jgi:hypothetical protein
MLSIEHIQKTLAWYFFPNGSPAQQKIS